MKLRELGITLLAGTALSACSQEVPRSAAGTPSAAPQGDVSSLIPLEQIYGVHSFFNEPGNEVQIQLASDYTQYAWQNHSRFQKGAIVARWGKPSELGYALDPSIDGIPVDFADGSTLTVDEFIDRDGGPDDREYAGGPVNRQAQHAGHINRNGTNV